MSISRRSGARSAGLLAVWISGFLFAGCATYEPPPWSTLDRVEGGVYLAELTTDGVLTAVLAGDPYNSERNPVLGKHPSAAGTALYFLGAAAVTMIIAEALPSICRKVWLLGLIGVESAAIANNVEVMNTR